MQQVHYGIVGLGDIFAVRHRAALTQEPAARIEAVCDANASLAEATAAELGCRAVTDYGQLLANERIDAVMILTPPATHAQLATQAAAAGKHVFCEKPLAPTLAGCRQMISAAKEAGVLLCVGENYVFDPFTAWITTLRDQGVLGEIRRLRFSQEWVGQTRRRFYESDVPCRNGAMMEDAVHLVALARHLLEAEPLKVTAAIRTRQPQRQVDDGVFASQVDDAGTVALEFASAGATLEAGWNVNPGLMHLEILGTRATIVAASAGWTPIKIHAVELNAGSATATPLEVPALPDRFPSQESYSEEDRLFTAAIANGTAAPYPGERAMRDVEILLAAHEASEQGRTLDIDPARGSGN